MELNVMSCLYINKWVPICRESVQCLIKMRLELKSGTQGAAENACPLIDILATVWHFLWSITVQIHGNIEAMCFHMI